MQELASMNMVGAFTVHQGKIYFSNFADQGFYVQNEKGDVEAIITEKTTRYANPVFDQKRKAVYAIEEIHCSEHEVVNRLVKIGKNVEVIAEETIFTRCQLCIRVEPTLLLYHGIIRTCPGMEQLFG